MLNILKNKLKEKFRKRKLFPENRPMVFTCSKSTIETPKQFVKSVQS